MVKYYKKLPVIIEALQWTGNNKNEMENFIKEQNHFFIGNDFYLNTLEGQMKVNNFDFVIKGVKGEFYPCKPDIFNKTYEEVRANNA